MSKLRLILAGLRHYRRSALAVILGAAVSVAVLTGALMVGDSVKGSLKDMALERIGRTESALIGREHFFTLALADKLEDSAPVLAIRGIVSVRGGQQRLPDVNFYGIDSRFNSMAYDASGPIPGEGECAINSALAEALDIKAGEEILLRFEKADQLSQDLSFVADKDMNKALRLKVAHIRTTDQLGNFGLTASQITPLNVFLNLKQLGTKLGLDNKTNLLISRLPADTLEARAGNAWTFGDGGLHIKRLEGRDIVELTSDRVFLRSKVAETALFDGWAEPDLLDSPNSDSKSAGTLYPVCSYFINRAEVKGRISPYFFGASQAAPLPGLGNNEVVVNQWLADDLQIEEGEAIELFWYKPGLRRQLSEEGAEFKVRKIIPVNNLDRDLMLPIPGLKDADSCSEWDPAIPVDLDLIRDKDEEYWDDYRGTPKVYVSVAGARKHWANQFGNTTAIRYGPPWQDLDVVMHLAMHLTPSDFGVTTRDIRTSALAAGKGATDFGGLFVGLGMFIIASALILTGILFAFMIESRAEETGLYLALGFRAKAVRRLLMGEALLLNLGGLVLGIPLAIAYVKVVLWALSTLWAGAVGSGTILSLHLEPMTILIGSLISLVLNLLVIRLVLRRLLGKSPVSLQSGAASLSVPLRPVHRRRNLIISLVCIGFALFLVLLSGPNRGREAVGAFFGAGALVLIGGILLSGLFLRPPDRKSQIVNPKSLKLSANFSRGLAVISMLACGLFVTIAVAANYADPMADLHERRSGTGGFTLFGS
ncbi:FtsX-like permease family protein, partial [Planctomycetota bacterium]